MPKIDRLERSSHAAFLRGVVLLTETQSRTLAKVFCGQQPAEIATELRLTLPTIKMHLSLALKKLNSPSVGQAAIDLLRLSHSVDELTQEERLALSALSEAFPEIERGKQRKKSALPKTTKSSISAQKPTKENKKNADGATVAIGVPRQAIAQPKLQRRNRASIWRRYAKS